MIPTSPTNFDHAAPAKAEPCCKSNQCYFGQHEECWMSKLCDCECHVSSEYPGVAARFKEDFGVDHPRLQRKSEAILGCHWCGTYEGVKMCFGRPLCPKCEAGERVLYERD